MNRSNNKKQRALVSLNLATFIASLVLGSTVVMLPTSVSAVTVTTPATCITHGGMADFLWRANVSSRYLLAYDVSPQNAPDGVLNGADLVALGNVINDSCAGQDDDRFSTTVINCITPGGMADFQWRFGVTHGYGKYMAKYDVQPRGNPDGVLDSGDFAALGNMLRTTCGTTFIPPFTSPISNCITRGAMGDFQGRFGSTLGADDRYLAMYDVNPVGNPDGTLDGADFARLGNWLRDYCYNALDGLDFGSTQAVNCMTPAAFGDFSYRFGSTEGDTKFKSRYDVNPSVIGDKTLGGGDLAALGNWLQDVCFQFPDDQAPASTSSSSTSTSTSTSSSSSSSSSCNENCSSSSSSVSTSSSSSSSTPCNENCGSSSSSTGGSSSSPLEQFAIAGTSGEGRAGGYRGHETNIAFGVAKYLADQSGITTDLPPGGFGGTNNTPFSDSEIDYLCSLQRMNYQVYTTFMPLYADYIAQFLGRDPAMIAEFLGDQSNCESLNSALLSKAVAKAELIEIRTDAKSHIVTDNEFWNICFATHGEFAKTASEYKKVYAMQTEVNRDGEKRSCSSYYSNGSTGEIWTTPENDSLPVYTFEYDRNKNTYKLPASMKLAELKKVVQK